MIKKKIFGSVFAILLAITLVIGFFTACGGASDPDDQDPPAVTDEYEFVFTGSAEFTGGRTLNVTIYGNKDNGQTFTLRVAEYPQIRISGTWVLVENKGYKVYFNDATSTYEYCDFDDATNTFSFNYNLDLGEVIGNARLTFSYVDEDFEYDGIGLGRKPPVFTANDGGLLTCNEDGTFTAGTRTGTWEYDSEADVYRFDFDFDNGYNTIFQLNEAWDGGYYCGYNRVDSVHAGDSSTGERQLELLGFGSDPLCINVDAGKLEYDMMPMNEPYKSAAKTTELEGGLVRVDVDVASLENLEEIVEDMEAHRLQYHGPNAASPVNGQKLLEHYSSLPEFWYVIDTQAGTYDFMPEVETVYNEDSGAYELNWICTNGGKYQLHVGAYAPED